MRVAGRCWITLLSALLVLAVLPATQARAQEPAVHTTELVVPNHGFEEGLSGWQPTDGRGGSSSSRCADAVEVDDAWAHDGVAAAAFSGRPPCVVAGLLSDPVAITGGEPYAVFAHTDGVGTVGLSIRFYDDAGAELGADRGARRAAGGIVEHHADAPAGATAARVEIDAVRQVRVDTVLMTAGITRTDSQITRPGTFYAMAAGYDADGRAVTFTVATGNAAQPAILITTDLLTNQVTDTVDLPGATGAWSVEYDHGDGTVYAGSYSGANVYAWQPGDPEVTVLGTPPLDRIGFVYGIAATGDGRVFGGAWGEETQGYAGAQLWQFDSDGGLAPFGPTPLTDDAMYTRAVAYDDATDSLWAGTGTEPHLYGCRTDTEECTDFTALLPEAIRSQAWVYGLTAGGGYVQVWGGDSSSTGNDHLVVLKVGRDAAGEPTAEVVADIPEVIYNGSTPVIDDTIYYTLANTSPEINLHSLNVVTGDTREITSAPTGIFSRQWELLDLRDPEWPGTSVVGWNSQGWQVAWNIETENFSRVQIPDIPPIATSLNALTTGPDGRVWSAGHLQGGIAVESPMQPDAQQAYLLGGQAENMISYRGRIWQGSYPDGQIRSFTPAEAAAGTAPRTDCTIGADQNRPYGLVGMGDRLYYGSQSGYGADGGAFGWLDLNTGECTTLTEPVGLLSVNSVTAVPGVGEQGTVVGGTNVYYGWDSEAVLEVAPLLVHDVAAGTTTMIDTPVPVRSIDAVITGADGIVWAYAQGWLFGYRPADGTWVHSEQVFPDGATQGRIGGNETTLIAHPDGSIYGNAKGRVFGFDPRLTLRRGTATTSLRVLHEGNGRRITVDEYGSLWVLTDQTRLLRIDPSLVAVR